MEAVPRSAPEGLCLNCGAAAPRRFCPECGQSTRLEPPTVAEILLDAFGAVFSYDSKVWRTAWNLACHPGKLTVEYFAGRRVAYLSPLQIFVWLQTIAFLVHRELFFDDDAAIGAKSRFLVIMGGVVSLELSLFYARRRLRFVHHLVAAVHLWAFLMLLLLVEYATVPLVTRTLIRLGLLRGSVPEGLFVTYGAEAVMAFYTMVAIRRIYFVPWRWAALQTATILLVYTAVARAFARATGMV